jgi:hypothetical protein
MDTTKFQHIRSADRVLSACGRYVPPVGSVVYIPKSFLLQAVLPTTSNQTFYKEITGDTTWCWRSISTALSGVPPSLSALVMLPDGKVLSNALIDLTVVAGFGSNRYLISPEIECPPGSKIQVSMDDNYMQASAVQPVSLLCGGAYAYYLKDGHPSVCPEKLASDMPRVVAGPNQNILAPCWMGGYGPSTPHGFEDEYFIYGDGTTNVGTITLGGILSTNVTIQIANENDFHVRRFLFDVTKAAGVSAGRFLARIRAGSGYSFTDDYVDVSKYLGSTPYAKGWDVKRGDQIEFDLVLVDGAGSGTITIECFADGCKRRPA